MKIRQKQTMPAHFALLPKLIATSFGFGFFPKAPGTAGAVFGALVWLPIALFADVTVALLVTLALILFFTAAGVWAANIAEHYWGPDPSRVVMDETVGQWITMLPMCYFAGTEAPLETLYFWVMWAVSLLFFRFFDIVKPLGVRNMEKLPGGTGVMADDILAGIYGAICMYIIMTLF